MSARIVNPTKKPVETIVAAVGFDQAFTLLESSLECQPGIFALVDLGQNNVAFIMNRYGTFKCGQDARVEIYV